MTTAATAPKTSAMALLPASRVEAPPVDDVEFPLPDPWKPAPLLPVVAAVLRLEVAERVAEDMVML
jgi:hypothetical protein